MNMEGAITTLDNVMQALDPLLSPGARMSGREVGMRIIGSINDIERVKTFLETEQANVKTTKKLMDHQIVKEGDENK